VFAVDSMFKHERFAVVLATIGRALFV